MHIKTQEAKAGLRRRIRAALQQLTAAQRAAASTAACALIEKQAVWQSASSVLFYAPLPGELNIWPLLLKSLAAGKRVALPKFDRDTNHYAAARIADVSADIVAGKLGIREPAGHCPPIAFSQLDLVLVPGVAFDSGGHRLGRGKGYYDRMLAQVRGITCGVAFDEQITAQIPVEPHDIRLKYILTPTRWLGFP